MKGNIKDPQLLLFFSPEGVMKMTCLKHLGKFDYHGSSSNYLLKLIQSSVVLYKST